MQKLWIPGRMPGLNEMIEGARGAGKGTGRKWQHDKKGWEHKIGLLAHVQGLKSFGPSCFTYVFLEPNKKRDPSNVTACGKKIIEDALQSEGFLENDGWKHVLGCADYWDVSADAPGVCVIIDDHVWGDRLVAVEFAREVSKLIGVKHGQNASAAGLDWSDRLGPDSAARDLLRCQEGGG